MTPFLLLLLVGWASCMSFPFELGGDQARDMYYPYRRMNGRTGFGSLPHPSMRQQRMRPRPKARQRASRQQQEEEAEPQGERMSKEDEEKVRQAIETRDFIVDRFLPMMQGMLPGPNMLGGMIPRMRRSVQDEDQLGLPSEQMEVTIPSQSEPTMAYVPAMLVPAEGRSEESEENMPILRGSRGTDSQQMGFPFAQILPASLVPRPPQASISSTQGDDKIYFAVDRQTILDFLGALFRGDKTKPYN